MRGILPDMPKLYHLLTNLSADYKSIISKLHVWAKRIENEGTFICYTVTYGTRRENLSSGFGNNSNADQPAHLRSLLSAFFIRF